ncbi:MAG: cyclase family protein [Gammaproteobacteria bacterium]|nr:cyclase family protein [Gammaproteobacteria bacterium]
MRALLSLTLICLLEVLPFSVNAEIRYLDLTHPFDETTIYWPTDLTFHLDENHKGLTKGGYWYESNNYRASEHGGTHVDAPVHFSKGKWTVDSIPLSHLIGTAVKIDVSKKAHPDFLIGIKDIKAWEKRHGLIPEGTIVLFATGWEKFWPDKKRYLGSEITGDTANLHFPGFSAQAADYLSNSRKVHAVGLDTPSLDYGQSRDFKAHQIFGAANVAGFENLHNLTHLPAKGFRVIALPMKIGRGSGAPLRIVAELK